MTIVVREHSVLAESASLCDRFYAPLQDYQVYELAGGDIIVENAIDIEDSCLEDYVHGKGDIAVNGLQLGVASILAGDLTAGLNRLHSDYKSDRRSFRSAIALAVGLQPVLWSYSIDLLRSASEAGDANAMAFLGIGKATGAFGMPSGDFAVKWLRQSYEQGNTMGKAGLGMLACLGLGVDQDTRLGLELLEAAANDGSVWATVILGQSLSAGTCGEKNLKRAFEWFEVAAKRGSVHGRQYLADAYENGDGVASDIQESAYWRKAAQRPRRPPSSTK